ncbi:MAG: signal peptidase II [Balneolaceae bacterium]|nr:signal peptidase II [Balneolaceae bacterium]
MSIESSHNAKLWALSLPAVLVVVLDQVTKYLVRTTPELQNWDLVPGLLSFHYTQNPGMALGMDWAPTPVISSVAIVVALGLLVYILKTLHHATAGYLVCMGLIIGGAFGNIIDRLIMAKIQGYGGVLDGHVVDFIHFTMIAPDWVPWLGGYPVFPYIFNIADSAISVAIVVLLLFHQKFLHPQTRGDSGAHEAAETSPEGTATP